MEQETRAPLKIAKARKFRGVFSKRGGESVFLLCHEHEYLRYLTKLKCTKGIRETVYET